MEFGVPAAVTILVPIALLGIIPLSIWLFAVLPPRRAVLSALLIGWLFLPIASYSLAGLPDYNKVSATYLGIVLGAALLDPERRLFRLRLRWFDVALLAWCVAPFFSSLSNGLGVYDGVSQSFASAVKWGVPYVVGRAYFSDRDGLRDIAVAVFIGGLVYVPLCLWEIRMSPQLHRIFYGYHQHSFMITKRFGGFRPNVFLEHGLALGMWMTTACLAGIAVWESRLKRELWGLPVSLLLGVLLVTTVLCKSAGALILLVAGSAVYFITRRTRRRVWVLAMIAFIPVYLGSRIWGDWSGQELVAWATKISEARAVSLGVRFEQEAMLKEHALERPVFGWGGWGRSEIKDRRGRTISITDSLWIVALGKWGLFGLGSVLLVMLLPVLYVLFSVPQRGWSSREAAPLLGVTVVLALFAIDNLVNGNANPVYLVAAGGLLGIPVRALRAVGAAEAGAAEEESSRAEGAEPAAPREPVPARDARLVAARKQTRPRASWRY
jgi:hypothetical protein